jgi:type I restriction enzyme S subunit
MQPGIAYSRADIADALGLSVSDWNWAIRQLKEEGRVVQTGERRGARYNKLR